MGLNLFDDGNDDSNNDDISKISIDEEFARRYEHNKKREDLHRLEELKKKGIIDESSDSEESESEDEDLITASKKDLEFFEALVKIKKQDPSIKEKDVKLFADESEDEDEQVSDEEDGENVGKVKKEKKGKAMYLKDVLAKHLIEDGPEEYDEEGEKDGSVSRTVKSYADEQEEMKRAFLNAVMEEEDEEGDLLKEKRNDDDEDDVGDDNDQDGEMLHKKVNEYFGKDGELDENKRFLKDFFLNKMYVDKDKGKNVVDEELDGLSDEEEINKQEDYEAEYNFRYQENAGDRVRGHSRFVEGSVRKKTNARQVQRKSKEERMAIAELERQKELKHLKNLKKKEYLEKIQKVKEVAGISDRAAFMLNEDDFEEEYDPKEHDRKMNEMFNEDYYGTEDANPEFCSDMEEDGVDIGKPDFDKEDELLGLPKDWDVLGSDEQLLGAGHTSSKRKVGTDDQEEEEEGEEEVPEERGEGKRKRKRRPSLLEKVALEEDLEGKYEKELEDELYKLDYEGTIGDMKTRFSYRKVQPKRFGLSTEEIMMMDDAELNQYVSLKKIAPYREKEWKVPDMKRYQQKMKNKELLQGSKLDEQKSGKKKRFKINGQRLSVKDDVEEGKAQDSNADMGSTSRQSRRRRRQSELKLSHSRLMAYGKIPSNKPKRKTKH